MKVKIKKLHPDAVIPSYAKKGDAGMDLTAVSNGEVTNQGTMMYKTGLSIEIPKGHVGLIFPRSSIFKSTGRMSNAVGVIDSGYRGELIFQFDMSIVEMVIRLKKFRNEAEITPYKKGDRIGQLIIIPYPQIEFEEVDELSTTERGSGGHGSTGK